MFTIVLVLGLGVLIAVASERLQQPNVDHRLTALLFANYAIRLAISFLTRDLNVFTSAGVDYSGYEAAGEMIARLWRYTGIHYVGGDEIPVLRETSLPSNIFACVIYLNGETTHLGCTAVIASVACLVCLNLYLIARLLGARQSVALWTTALIAVLPSFLFYTSNTYKDGFVALFVIGIFGCALRLARKFSTTQLVLAFVFLVGLWFTRFYLVFIVPAPLLLGFLGLNSRSILRTVLAALVVVASVSALYAYSSAPEIVVNHATRTFEHATSDDALNANAEAGSGVTFDPTSPTGSFVPKLMYTLFSPFPWQSGSMGLQFAKVEAIVWYYFIYRAIQAARRLWHERRSDLLTFVSFVLPLAVAYAFSFSNIGLIVRQRMDIVLATMIFATVSWGRQEAVAVLRLPATAQTTA
jgi:hypothetical protein